MRLRRRYLASVVLLVSTCTPGVGRAADTWVEVRSPHFTVASNSGDKEARRVADRFERIRAVFQSGFPTLRVDPGKPMKIIAVKNEDSIKVLLPDYWASKDRMRPAGYYVSSNDEDFAVMRTDISGTAENAYHVLYHEYTHAILRLNFSSLPTWLDEGLAEFYGNTVVEDNEAEVGRVSRVQLNLLRRSSFIPIEQLMIADARSPFINERDRANMFYAESWAVVHYLIYDPEPSRQHSLSRYLGNWEETGDGLEAARRTFGDLKKFESRIESYCRQSAFTYSRRREAGPLSTTGLAVRPLSAAEALVVQADFLQQTNHLPVAREMLRQAATLQPDLPFLQTCLAIDSYTQYNNADAEKEFRQAAALDAQDFRPPFYLAHIILRESGYTPQSTLRIIENLEKTVQLRPDFAPAWAFLSVAYRHQPDTKQRALDAAHKANNLEPAVMAYRVDVFDALLALDREADARATSEILIRSAHTPAEKEAAQNAARRLARYEEGKAGRRAPATTATPVAAGNPGEHGSTPQTRVEEGLIREADCGAPGQITIRFAILGETLVLSASDPAKVALRSAGKDLGLNAIPCSDWKGRKARIAFTPASNPDQNGSILAVDFF